MSGAGGGTSPSWMLEGEGQGNVGGGRLLVWRTEDKAVQAGSLILLMR